MPLSRCAIAAGGDGAALAYVASLPVETGYTLRILRWSAWDGDVSQCVGDGCLDHFTLRGPCMIALCFAQLLQVIRYDLHLPLSELALRLHLWPESYQAIERGE